MLLLPLSSRLRYYGNLSINNLPPRGIYSNKIHGRQHCCSRCKIRLILIACNDGAIRDNKKARGFGTREDDEKTLLYESLSGRRQRIYDCAIRWLIKASELFKGSPKIFMRFFYPTLGKLRKIAKHKSFAREDVCRSRCCLLLFLIFNFELIFRINFSRS